MNGTCGRRRIVNEKWRREMNKLFTHNHGDLCYTVFRSLGAGASRELAGAAEKSRPGESGILR